MYVSDARRIMSRLGQPYDKFLEEHRLWETFGKTWLVEAPKRFYFAALLSLRAVRLGELYGGDPADRRGQPNTRDPDRIAAVKAT